MINKDKFLRTFNITLAIYGAGGRKIEHIHVEQALKDTVDIYNTITEGVDDVVHE